MTTPHRSTRRSVNPPEDKQPPEELKGRAQNLAEVESILDEIENLVSNRANDTEDTAKPTTVFEDPTQGRLEEDDVRSDSAVDLGRLEEELHSAIASELETTSKENNLATTEIVSEHSIPEDEITKLAEVFEEAEAANTRPERFSRSRDLVAPEPCTETNQDSIPVVVNEKQGSGVVKMLSRPMEGLSPTMRLVINITAITLALWVPIIWLVVLNGGFSRQDTKVGVGPDSALVDTPISAGVKTEQDAP